MEKHPVYPSWAFSENEMEKRDANATTHRYLRETYRIATSWQLKNDGMSQEDFDIVYESLSSGYGHHKYRILKNGPNLSNDRLALICDSGNLCFGYRMEGGAVVIHTD